MIRVPDRFPSGGRLLGGPKDPDPREHPVPAHRVELDLRSWRSVHTPAALWIAVYSLLVRRWGTQCRVFLPTAVPVRGALMALGVGDLLRAAEVEVVDDDSAGPADGSAVLSLRTFWTVGEVETLANRAVEVLQDRGWGAANLRPVITEAFTELAVNVVEHAHSVIGGLALIRLSRPPEKPRFECAVADGGIGVRSALTKNPRLRDRVSYDWDALDLATRERISGTGDPSRGIGLFGVAEEMRKPGRRLLLHSGNGLLQIDERAQLQARRKPFFPGTLACVAVPT